jgi:RecQ family ATP-dependent DNA helicase
VRSLRTAVSDAFPVRAAMDAAPAAPAAAAPAAAHNDALDAALREHWGVAAFRPLQREACRAVLAGRDVLLVLATGSGKSLCFQLPAAAAGRVAVVVTPLLALARDQVQAALDGGLDAAEWTSTTPEPRRARLAAELADADASLRLLYTTPESLAKPELFEALRVAHAAGRLACLAVDEAHCVCAWGHDFRPAYLALGDARRALPGLPVIAVTATATPEVRRGIAEALALRPGATDTLLGSFDRPNLALRVVHKELLGGGGGGGERAAALTALAAFAAARPGASGIVYARLRADADAVADALSDSGVEAAAYHAGLDAGRRARVQRDFMGGGIDVVCATVAFGMGIDKPDVRYVLHFDAPASLEGYYQEAGRAGRDGAPAECVLFAADAELRRLAALERGGGRAGGAAGVASYLQGGGCRRAALLAHFGERRGACTPGAGEAACDACADPAGARRALARLEAALEARAAAREGGGNPYDRGDEEAAPAPRRAQAVPVPAPPAQPKAPPRPVVIRPLRRAVAVPAAAAVPDAAAEEARPPLQPPNSPPAPPAAAAPKRVRLGFQPPRRLAAP